MERRAQPGLDSQGLERIVQTQFSRQSWPFVVETGQRGEEQGCGEMRGLCWALRDGTAGLEVEHLDDNDAYREVWDSANKSQSCMGRGGQRSGPVLFPAVFQCLEQCWAQSTLREHTGMNSPGVLIKCRSSW